MFGELLYLVIFYSTSGADFSLLQQAWKMGSHHRLLTNATNGKMLEEPRKRQLSHLVTSLT